jgi:mono/diheme cytochrome c family protein
VSEDRSGRELTPRPEEPSSAVTPRESQVPGPVTEGDRFYAGDRAHTVGLTEERAAQIVKQSGNARMMAFLGALFLVLFIPIYWLYDIGMPVIGDQGRLAQENTQQQVTDISRGYALFLANCARCHGNNGEGLVGPPLNDQAKLYNALTPQGLPGNGHLNPDYLTSVLTEGGRYVCGDPNSIMPAWLQPKGPLNYRQVKEIIDWITASKAISFVYQPVSAEGGANASVLPPITVTGWRDPAYTPAPGATPVPACWRGTSAAGGGSSASSAPSAAPVTSPGTAQNPRVIQVEGNEKAQWVDATTGQPITSLTVVPGETIQFQVKTDALAHNFHIGAATDLSAAPEHNDLPGLDTFSGGTQNFTYTVNNLPANAQFACTVPGHYPSMHVDLVAQQGSGASGSAAPAASAGGPAASGAPASSAAPSSAPSS